MDFEDPKDEEENDVALVPDERGYIADPSASRSVSQRSDDISVKVLEISDLEDTD